MDKKRSRNILLTAIVCFTNCAICYSQNPGDYRSRQTGAWGAVATWEMYNGTTWVAASAIPTAQSGVINIVNGHTVTAGGSFNANQVTINNGGTFIISSGTFTVTDTIGTEINCNGNFSFTGGTLVGNGNIEINSGGNFVWDGATINGNITTNITAGASFSMPAGANVLGGSSSPVINNYGDCTWLNGNIVFNNGSPVLNNYGNLNIYTDADVTSSSTTTGSFNNKTGGTINKIGSPDDYTVFSGAVSFFNDGIVNINSSFLRFYIPFQHRGQLLTGFGAGAYFTDGKAAFTASSSISGDGNLFFDGATATINSNAVSVRNITVSADTLTISSGISISNGCAVTLSGGVLTGSGTIDFADGSIFNWDGGVNGGSGTINIAANAVMNLGPPGRYFADTKTINNYGICNWNDGVFTFNSGNPVFNNFGTLNINSDDAVNSTGSSAGLFVNQPAGVINKIGAPGSYSNFYGNVSLTNKGSINVNSGSMLLQLNSYHYGNITSNFGSAFELHSDTAFVFQGTSINGYGELDFSGAVALVSNADFSISSINISAGTVTSNYSSVVNLGCSVNFSNGTLNGTGNIEFKNGSNFYWTGGINSGSGTITIDSGAVFSTSGGTLYFTETKKLNNYGTWIWDAGIMNMLSGTPVVNNYASLNITDDVSLYVSAGAVFNNQPAGTIVKEGAANAYTPVSGAGLFNNLGITNIQSGNINISAAGQHSGTYNISLGGELSGNASLPFTGTNFNNNGYVTLTSLLFNGIAVQYLNGDGVIEKAIINNTQQVILTEAQRVTGNLNVSPGAKLLVYRNMIVQ